MPDISMCLNSECSLKQNCYRYRAVPGFNQSYTMFIPVNRLKTGESCDYFYKIETYHQTKDV